MLLPSTSQITEQQKKRFRNPEQFRSFLREWEGENFAPRHEFECPINQWAVEVFGMDYEETGLYIPISNDGDNSKQDWNSRYYVQAGDAHAEEWGPEDAESFLDEVLEQFK